MTYSNVLGKEKVNMDRKYLSYLLRVWRVEEDGEFAWRASLEVTHSGERYGFATLDGLFAYLKEQTQINGEKDVIRGGPAEG
jgi:hypothetical protein